MKVATKILLRGAAACHILSTSVTLGDVMLSTAAGVGTNSSSLKACVHDAIRIGWELKEWNGGEELVWAEVHDLAGTSNPVSRFDLFQQRSPTEREPSSTLTTVMNPAPEMFQRLHSIIQSREYGPFVAPEVRTVEWSRAGGRESLVLIFTSPTNRPILSSSASINNAIVFNHGDIDLATGRGSWNSGGDALTITDLDSLSWKAIMASISDGELHVAPRKKLLIGSQEWVDSSNGTDNTSAAGHLGGNLTMRILFSGRFVAHLYVGERLDSISAQVIEVDTCEEVVVPAPKAPSHGRSEIPGSTFSASGVLGFPGNKFLKVPSSLFDVQQRPPGGGVQSELKGSWTYAFWIYLLEDATGSFRGLFYKGNGGESGRTPSAWLHPYSNRIALRVTSETNPDQGADTIGSLKVNTWSHLAFAFDNSTERSFKANIYINGALDISVKFTEIVLGNTGPLHIGRDPSNLGPRSLVSMARLWQNTLSSDEVDAVFRASQPLFVGKASHTLASRYSSIHAVESRWTRKNSRSKMLEEGALPTDNEAAPLNIVHVDFERAASEAAMMATALCKTFNERLDMYRVAAEAGHTESRVSYASLLLAGREQLDGEAASSCGREEEADVRARAVAQWNAGGARIAIEQLDLAVEGGSHRGAYILAVLLFSGLGGIAPHAGPSTDCASRLSRASPTFEQLPFVGAVRDQWANTTCDAPTTARAIALLHFAAVGGHPEAQLALGSRYLEGVGVQRDVETAAFYLGCAANVAHSEYHTVGKQPVLEMQRLTAANEANVEVGQRGEDDDLIQYQILRAEQGDLASIEALADLYYWGARGLPRDHHRALQYFTLASNAGSNNARCAAAGMLLKGEGADANHTKAMELYELAAMEDHVRALNGLGFIYFKGQVIPQNFTKAFGFFERAANMQQDGDSIFNAAHCLVRGIGTDQDVERAAKLFRLAASWNHVDSAFELGQMYTEGTGVERNPTHAAKYLSVVAQVGPWGRKLRSAFDCYLLGDRLSAFALYAQMAELGYKVAASNAAFLLDSGKISFDGPAFQGVAPAPKWTDTMSLHQHALAAMKGQLDSFLAIGDAFLYGQAGLRRDSSSACWWYARASSSGMIRGSYNLAYMYEFGLGVPLDYGRALMFYDRALKSSTSAVDNVNQDLSGLPVQLLIYVAKARLYLNRASGGWLANLWPREENEEGLNGTKDRLPDWILFAALSETLDSMVQWVADMWGGSSVLDLDNSDAQPHMSHIAMLNELQAENVLLLVYSSLLLLLLFLRRRRRK